MSASLALWRATSRPAETSAPSHTHIAEFDGLRAIAFLLTLAFHTRPSSISGGGLMRSIGWVASFGWSGVDLFFVLSGFLITGILLTAKGTLHYFSYFYARRFLRIFPLYYLALILLALTRRYWTAIGTPLPVHLWPQFLYVSNWTDVLQPFSHLQVVGHLWSLAIEEQFYLLWPLCVWFVPARNLWKACLAGIAIALLSRCCLVWSGGHPELVYKALFARMDSLLIGALAALVARNPPLLARVSRSALPGAVVLLGSVVLLTGLLSQQPYANAGPFVESVGFTLLAAGFGLLILWAYAGSGAAWLRGLLRSKPLVEAGLISYGLYVYHVPILQVLSFVIRRWRFLPVRPSLHWGLYVLLVLVATLITAKISYQFYEVHFLKWKEHFKLSVCSSPAKARSAAVH